jgi:hypothetical protein
VIRIFYREQSSSLVADQLPTGATLPVKVPVVRENPQKTASMIQRELETFRRNPYPPALVVIVETAFSLLKLKGYGALHHVYVTTLDKNRAGRNGRQQALV